MKLLLPSKNARYFGCSGWFKSLQKKFFCVPFGRGVHAPASSLEAGSKLPTCIHFTFCGLRLIAARPCKRGKYNSRKQRNKFLFPCLNYGFKQPNPSRETVFWNCTPKIREKRKGMAPSLLVHSRGTEFTRPIGRRGRLRNKPIERRCLSDHKTGDCCRGKPVFVHLKSQEKS